MRSSIRKVIAGASPRGRAIPELRFSEDEAFRRVTAARLARRFPALLDAVAAGELHLTGLLMLGPHLGERNVVEVIARAKHRTKREIARLVRMLDPSPPVPALIEPLGPAPVRVVPPEPTWSQFMDAMNPVRELERGERPREWGVENAGACATGAARPAATGPERYAAARVDTERCGEVPTALRYEVQFTATEEYVRLVDEAKALLSHIAPRASLEEVQLRAIRALVDALRKRKYGSKIDTGETGNAAALRAIDRTAYEYTRVRSHTRTSARNRSQPIRRLQQARPTEPRR